MGGAGLSACGFTPLYANPNLTPALQAVDVVVPQSRTGYLLREQLNDELGRNLATGPRYRLTVTLEERRIPRGLRVNNIAAVYQVGLSVSYTLTDAATGAVLLRAAAPVTVSYDAPDQPYASVAAQQDAEERAANQAAIRIRLDLSRFFNRTKPAR
jgi:LPS-assembly lipoprotein